MQNFMSSMKPGGGDGGGKEGDDIPWWMKYASKGAGITSGVVAIVFGVMCLITFHPACIVAGIWQILAGFVVIILEAPFCCMFLEPVQKFSGVIESRPIWQKAALYLVISLPAVIFCLTLSTVVGSGLIFATAVINGMQVLGKKASQEEMKATAVTATASQPTSSDKSGLVGNIEGQDVEAATVPK